MNFSQIRKLNATEAGLNASVAQVAELRQQMLAMVKRIQILEEEVKLLQTLKPATRRTVTIKRGKT